MNLRCHTISRKWEYSARNFGPQKIIKLDSAVCIPPVAGRDAGYSFGGRRDQSMKYESPPRSAFPTRAKRGSMVGAV